MNVFINLPVSDLARSRRFYTAMGFSFDERFSNDKALAVVVSEEVHLMLLTREMFQTFTPRAVADATSATEALIALQLDSRADVQAMVATALANGGSTVREEEDHGFMFTHAIADPDGHIFEPFVMDVAAMESQEAAA